MRTLHVKTETAALPLALKVIVTSRFNKLQKALTTTEYQKQNKKQWEFILHATKQNKQCDVPLLSLSLVRGQHNGLFFPLSSLQPRLLLNIRQTLGLHIQHFSGECFYHHQ